MKITVEKSGRTNAAEENTERLRELIAQAMPDAAGAGAPPVEEIYDKAAAPGRSKPNIGFGRAAKAIAKKIEKRK